MKLTAELIESPLVKAILSMHENQVSYEGIFILLQLRGFKYEDDPITEEIYEDLIIALKMHSLINLIPPRLLAKTVNKANKPILRKAKENEDLEM